MARGGMRYGAGRPGWHAKAEHCLRLDIRDLARRDLLCRAGFTWQWTDKQSGKELGRIGISTIGGDLTLNYAVNGQPVTEHIGIERTECNFGGTRPWLHCPRCGSRVAVLFLRGSRFTCRPCGRIAYGSQADDLVGRLWRKQRKLERRLGENWRRPKGMHQKTRQRIVTEILECEARREAALLPVMARFLLRQRC